MKTLLDQLVDQAPTPGRPLSADQLQMLGELADAELSMLPEAQRRNLLAEVIQRLNTGNARHDARLMAAAMSLRLEKLAQRVSERVSQRS